MIRFFDEWLYIHVRKISIGESASRDRCLDTRYVGAAVASGKEKKSSDTISNEAATLCRAHYAVV